MLKTVAERLTEMKQDAGLSNRKLAELSGVPEGTVNKILSGNTTRPSFEDVEAIVRAMGRGIDEIFGEPETPSEVQTAVIDHYSLLIESYKDQIRHYEKQIEALTVSHKDQLGSHRRAFWALFLLVLLLIALMAYICIDASHGNWGIFQYPMQ